MSSDQPPLLTALQFAVIDCLKGQRLKGRDLRDSLATRNIKKDGPAFYMMMGRMEKSGLIDSETTDVRIADKIYKEKTYWVVSEGMSAFQRTREYYSTDWETGSLETSKSVSCGLPSA